MNYLLTYLPYVFNYSQITLHPRVYYDILVLSRWIIAVLLLSVYFTILALLELLLVWANSMIWGLAVGRAFQLGPASSRI
ncbi:hypothetical protein BJX61DRAFT_151608 [Aspergillus egyptiacus]|nr:hypothetical protein BJX61DRAFT_151608 [Aspergillus egyptiacus]